MAPGPGGTLYALIPGPTRTVLALLDGSGQPRPGWPIRLPGMSFCWLLLPVDDGSVRVVCQGPDDPNAEGAPQAFAFDADGRPLPGWPVELPPLCCAVGRVIGDKLTVYARQYRGDSVDGWIVSVADVVSAPVSSIRKTIL